ncbi:MAG TPA: hypothetical protein VKR06_36600 [Ktedonosporobacter sp.]|nr:hypothetical protein [Ktedonosporobacter sp.]
MVRHLYRFYLYTVFIALLIFVAMVTGRLLYTLLENTWLRGSYGALSTPADIVQALTFAVVAWVIAGLVGGLHYWLIRRDIQHDPASGSSAIRSFFLNMTEALSVAVAVPVGGYALSALGYSSGSNVIWAVSLVLPALALAAVLELERQRTAASSGAALVFQRLHFYGVQLILLISLAFSWFSSIRPLVDELLFAGRGTLEYCHSSGYECSPPYNLSFIGASVAWFVIWWVVYGWATRKDSSRILRFILHGISLAYGVGSILTGIYLVVELLISPLFKQDVAFKDVLGLYPAYDFVSPLTLGILVVGVYHLWFRQAVQLESIERKSMQFMEIAIAAIVAAAIFWWGCGNLLYNALQSLSAAVPEAHAWISVIGSIVAGLVYIPLSLYLRRRYAVDATSASGPRRGFVLALLGGGILALAIGGATALYAWVTSLFGSPIPNWLQVAHTGLAAFVVGAILVAIYLWAALGEQLLSSRKTPSTPPVAVQPTLEEPPVLAPTIENILDELLAGKITRDEAAAHIRALEVAPAKIDR